MSLPGKTNGWKTILNTLTVHYGDRIADHIRWQPSRPLTQTCRVSLLGLPGLSARGLRSGSMLDADSTRFVALWRFAFLWDEV